MKTKSVFLGGTCNGSTWRDQMVALLTINSFNPVVPNWTDACYKEELRQRDICDFCLYVITPRMTGVYSIAELIDDSNKRPTKVVFVYLEHDDTCSFDCHQIKSLAATAKMVSANGGMTFTSLRSAASYMNNN